MASNSIKYMVENKRINYTDQTTFQPCILLMNEPTIEQIFNPDTSTCLAKFKDKISGEEVELKFWVNEHNDGTLEVISSTISHPDINSKNVVIMKMIRKRSI